MDFNSKPEHDPDFEHTELPAEPVGECIAESVVAAGSLASVLFPAKPPAPVNARLIRGYSFHDVDKKPLRLSRSAASPAPSPSRSYDEWQPVQTTLDKL